MPHDPRARVIRIEGWDPKKPGAEYHWVRDPKYGEGAYRDIVYSDGTIERRFVHLRSPEDAAAQGSLPPDTGYLIDEPGIDSQLAQTWDNAQPNPRTPEAEAHDKAVVERDKRTAEQENREEAERKRNYEVTNRYETDADKYKRETSEKEEARREADQRRQEQQFAQSTAAQEQANQLAQSRFGLDQSKYLDDKNKPTFLSQSGTDNPFITRYNPESGQIEQIANPNYDAVKVEGERLRQQLATQIQARQVTLDEAKMQYSQWFDSNVKTPLMLAQEARDKAAEQRAALDAEERRRQFAANFGLQKQELGQKAGQMMISAEESLLPYRAGPTEGPEMASAINGLAAGGTLNGPSASAGINFSPGAFSFNAPDFKKIAKDAAHQALSGLTDYRPAEGNYQTADYSAVPSVNLGGAPSIPQGYGAFQDIIDNLKNTYNFGGGQTRP